MSNTGLTAHSINTFHLICLIREMEFNARAKCDCFRHFIAKIKNNHINYHEIRRLHIKIIMKRICLRHTKK